MQKFCLFALILASSLILFSCTSTFRLLRAQEPSLGFSMPKNVILMIVDGMGLEYIKAARIYNGQKPFSFEHFECQSLVKTCSFLGADENGRCLNNTRNITDSAAGATAMATGVKVLNGVISRSIPGDRADIETILEIAKKMHKSTGIVATKLFTDATPAAFVSHANKRSHTEKILRDIFFKTTPNVILGADTKLHRDFSIKSTANYQYVHKSQDLELLSDKIFKGASCKGQDCPHIYGGFGQYENIPGRIDKEAGLPFEITPETTFSQFGFPHLSFMTSAALKILSKNERGFFLMVESSNPDTIGHQNEQIDDHELMPSAIEVLVKEMLEVEKTIKVIESFLASNPDTLLILTADHETGGLVVEEDKTACLGQNQCLPHVRWTSEKYEPGVKDSHARHTGVRVPLYATGKKAEYFCKEIIENTDIPRLILADKP